MLKSIDPKVTPDLLFALASMGHGDEIAIVDANFPSYSTAHTKKVLEMPGLDAPAVADIILQLIPLDTFVDAPCLRMEVVGAPEQWEPVQSEVQAVIERRAGSTFRLTGIERFEFYRRASNAFAIVRSGERRFYGCFLFKMGVIAPTSS